jgi:hypothetical protein
MEAPSRRFGDTVNRSATTKQRSWRRPPSQNTGELRKLGKTEPLPKRGSTDHEDAKDGVPCEGQGPPRTERGAFAARPPAP